MATKYEVIIDRPSEYIYVEAENIKEAQKEGWKKFISDNPNEEESAWVGEVNIASQEDLLK